jgi:hypothetical protein
MHFPGKILHNARLKALFLCINQKLTWLKHYSFCNIEKIIAPCAVIGYLLSLYSGKAACKVDEDG